MGLTACFAPSLSLIFLLIHQVKTRSFAPFFTRSLFKTLKMKERFAHSPEPAPEPVLPSVIVIVSYSNTVNKDESETL